MGEKFYNSTEWKPLRLKTLNKMLKEQVETLESENDAFCRKIWEVNSKNFELSEELERFKKLYQEAFEESIRLRHSEHKEKMIGEAIENELKRIIRQGYF